jgi:uncharacterized protein YodC (DUF2158 family)
MSAEIKPGSVVQLKSGGPLMTVSSVGDIYGLPTVFCDWFVQDKPPWKKEKGSFPPTSLKLIE